jgi:Leucine-rich repeat (LRR) protein
LPDCLGDLKKLQRLDLSYNNLKDLPCGLGQLTRLRTLNLSHNPKLTKLVKEMAQMRSLETMIVDAGSLVYPEAKVCREGTEAIMRFLCTGKNGGL